MYAYATCAIPGCPLSSFSSPSAQEKEALIAELAAIKNHLDAAQSTAATEVKVLLASHAWVCACEYICMCACVCFLFTDVHGRVGHGGGGRVGEEGSCLILPTIFTHVLPPCFQPRILVRRQRTTCVWSCPSCVTCCRPLKRRRPPTLRTLKSVQRPLRPRLQRYAECVPAVLSPPLTRTRCRRPCHRPLLGDGARVCNGVRWLAPSSDQEPPSSD